MPFGGGDAAEGEGEGEGEGEDPMAEDFGGGPSFAPKEIFFISEKGRLFAASSVAAMDTLLARVDGDRATCAQCGSSCLTRWRAKLDSVCSAARPAACARQLCMRAACSSACCVQVAALGRPPLVVPALSTLSLLA